MDVKTPEGDERGRVRQNLNKFDKIITFIIIAIFIIVLLFMFTYYAFG